MFVTKVVMLNIKYKMMIIKKMITNGYADFSKEVKYGTKVVYKGKTLNGIWAAKITNYVTNKKFHRVFVCFKNNELEIKPLKKGDVINLRNETKLNNNYSAIYEQYFLIIDINSNTITYENYPTVAKAIRAQKNMNYASANGVPVAVKPVGFFF